MDNKTASIKIVNNGDGSITIDRNSYRNLLLLTSKFINNNVIPNNVNNDVNNELKNITSELLEIIMLTCDIALFNTDEFSNLVSEMDSSLEIKYGTNCECDNEGDDNNYA